MPSNWYYAKGGQQHGPISARALVDLATAGQLRPDELVWKDGLASWVRADQVQDLLGPAAPGQPEAAVSDPEITAAAAGRGPMAMPPPTAMPGVQPVQAAPVSYYGPSQPPPPPNYLTQAILVTVCCCVPFGIPAIVFASQVNSKFQQGDVAGAIEASNKAKTWSWIAFVCGLVAGVIGGGLRFMAEMHR